MPPHLPHHSRFSSEPSAWAGRLAAPAPLRVGEAACLSTEVVRLVQLAAAKVDESQALQKDGQFSAKHGTSALAQRVDELLQNVAGGLSAAVAARALAAYGRRRGVEPEVWHKIVAAKQYALLDGLPQSRCELQGVCRLRLYCDQEFAARAIGGELKRAAIAGFFDRGEHSVSLDFYLSFLAGLDASDFNFFCGRVLPAVKNRAAAQGLGERMLQIASRRGLSANDLLVILEAHAGPSDSAAVRQFWRLAVEICRQSASIGFESCGRLFNIPCQSCPEEAERLLDIMHHRDPERTRQFLRDCVADQNIKFPASSLGAAVRGLFRFGAAETPEGAALLHSSYAGVRLAAVGELLSRAPERLGREIQGSPAVFALLLSVAPGLKEQGGSDFVADLLAERRLGAVELDEITAACRRLDLSSFEEFSYARLIDHVGVEVLLRWACSDRQNLAANAAALLESGLRADGGAGPLAHGLSKFITAHSRSGEGQALRETLLCWAGLSHRADGEGGAGISPGEGALQPHTLQHVRSALILHLGRQSFGRLMQEAGARLKQSCGGFGDEVTRLEDSVCQWELTDQTLDKLQHDLHGAENVRELALLAAVRLRSGRYTPGGMGEVLYCIGDAAPSMRQELLRQLAGVLSEPEFCDVLRLAGEAVSASSGSDYLAALAAGLSGLAEHFAVEVDNLTAGLGTADADENMRIGRQRLEIELYKLCRDPGEYLGQLCLLYADLHTHKESCEVLALLRSIDAEASADRLLWLAGRSKLNAELRAKALSGYLMLCGANTLTKERLQQLFLADDSVLQRAACSLLLSTAAFEPEGAEFIKGQVQKQPALLAVIYTEARTAPISDNPRCQDFFWKLMQDVCFPRAVLAALPYELERLTREDPGLGTAEDVLFKIDVAALVESIRSTLRPKLRHNAIGLLNALAVTAGIPQEVHEDSVMDGGGGLLDAAQAGAGSAKLMAEFTAILASTDNRLFAARLALRAIGAGACSDESGKSGVF